MEYQYSAHVGASPHNLWRSTLSALITSLLISIAYQYANVLPKANQFSKVQAPRREWYMLMSDRSIGQTLYVRYSLVGECFFSYAIYLCFGISPYFIGAYHRLIFLLAENGILSPDYASLGLLEQHLRFEVH